MQFKSQLAKKCHKQEPSPNFTFFHFYPSTTPLQTPHHTYKERKRKNNQGHSRHTYLSYPRSA